MILLTNPNLILLTKFFNSKRQEISPQTIRFYRTCLTPFLKSYPLTSQGINGFLSNLTCGNATHAYYRAIRAFCNPHTFRRTFASNLHRAGMDTEHIMRLGGWESLGIVVRYTRSVKFEDSMNLYKSPLSLKANKICN
ncbi:tyrosine-type recombinase/integrase [Chloroflexota bacterium]